MKLHPEDPRITAYLLGELSSEEAATIEEAAANDPAVLAALEETYQVQRLLVNTLASDHRELLPRQRETIRRAARSNPNAGEVIPFPARTERRFRYTVPLGIAAAIALVSWLALSPGRKPDRPSADIAQQPQSGQPNAAPDTPLPLAVAVLPAPGPKIRGFSSPSSNQKESLAHNVKALNAALQTASTDVLNQMALQVDSSPVLSLDSLPELVTRGPVSTAESQEMELPVLSGRSSLGWIYKSVNDHKILPAPKAVRLEEVLNSFDLRPNGTAAIAKGVSLSAETLSCPWKPSATLLMVHFQGAANGARKIEASLKVDPATVASYRLLGFSPVRGVESSPLPTHLPAKTGTTLLIELEPRASATALGEIKWKVEGSDAAPITIQRRPDTEPSNDARFSALLASYSLWLTKDQPDLIDKELVAGLARECAASDLPLNRREALILIGRSMEL